MEAPAPVMGTAIRYPVRFSVAYAEKVSSWVNGSDVGNESDTNFSGFCDTGAGN